MRLFSGFAIYTRQIWQLYLQDMASNAIDWAIMVALFRWRLLWPDIISLMREFVPKMEEYLGVIAECPSGKFGCTHLQNEKVAAWMMTKLPCLVNSVFRVRLTYEVYFARVFWGYIIFIGRFTHRDSA